jgi:hypothetical protein
MTPALVLALIGALITDFPALVIDIEKLIAAFKSSPGTPVTPVAPSVEAELNAADGPLNTPIK